MNPEKNEILQAKQRGQDICHTVIPFAKCRPIYKLKDLLASCSANVGQYRRIKQEGGDYHRATTAVAAKSTVCHTPPLLPSHHPSALFPEDSFPTRVLSATALLDDTYPGQARWRPGRH